MSDRHATILAVLSVVLTLWGVFLFFQSAYFGSFFYNVPTPWWAVWVGQIPIWWFDVIDTIMVAALIAAIILASEGPVRRVRGARGVGGWVLLLLGLFLLVAFLAGAGFTFLGLWGKFQSFWAGL